MKKRYLFPIACVLIVALIMVIVIISGDKEQKPSISIQDIEFSFTDNAKSLSGIHLCDNGFIQVSGEDLLTYTSFEHKASITLCNRLDCGHNNEDCVAWFGTDNVNMVYYYNDKQYLVLESRLSTYSKPVLYVADADGSNRQKVISFDLFNSGASDYTCIDNMLYMFLSDVDISSTLEEDDNGYFVEKPQTISLVTYNLDTEEMNILKMFDSCYQQFYHIEAEYDGKIYFGYQYSTRPQEDLYDENDMEISEVHEEAFRMGVGCIDVSDEEQPVISIYEDSSVTFIGMDDEKIYWYKPDETEDYLPYKIYVYNVVSELTDDFMVNPDVPRSSITMANNKLFFNYWEEPGFAEYDLQTGKVVKYEGVDRYVVGEYNNYYLLSGVALNNHFSAYVEYDSLENKNEYIMLNN